MKHITLPYPNSSAEAIRAVCYLNAWTVRKLAQAMGLANGSHLSQVVNHKEPGSAELTVRVLAHMPEKWRPSETCTVRKN